MRNIHPTTVSNRRATPPDALNSRSLAPVSLHEKPASESQVLDPRRTLYIHEAANGELKAATSSEVTPIKGVLPSLFPEFLGSKKFRERHGLRFSYVAGGMARGIASADLVVEIAKHGGLGFFGAAGVSVDRVSAAIDEIQSKLPAADTPFGVNLIHNVKDPEAECRLVELFLVKGVSRIEAAAFLRLTPAVVWFAFKGVRRDAAGEIIRPHQVFAKVSNPAVAQVFLQPAEEDMLQQLVRDRRLTEAEAELARDLPVARNITVEADSGGHTDNRPASALFPIINKLATDLTTKHGHESRPMIGLAGGLGTPTAVSAAFDLGADYVLVGSVHQSCLESGISHDARKLLERAGVTDFAMCPAADMFEEGAKVQVLKRGTMFSNHANTLGRIYHSYPSLDAIPKDERSTLERDIFKRPLDEIWRDTSAFFDRVDPEVVEKAEREPKHKLALICRWYLGKSSQWPIAGDRDRQLDFQLWSGPALGAFNDWVKGTFLESMDNRSVGQVMLNLLEGAAHHKRLQQLKSFGVDTANYHPFTPEPLRID